MNSTKIIPITITQNAKQEIQKALEIKGIPADYFLRVGLRGSACSATYIIGFDKKEEHDELYEIDGISLIINKHHLMYLIGVQLDFEEEGNGFTFIK
ncbi:HesB/IscA family protein [Flectobacillus major]|jgi:iron-sulfur cluster assembly protein|uniref:HesB/IscA family protein n=1 Tax=Flectobacillus major TaxID=103 RepID=UPI0004281892|nr:iron-sulfur cluster biosynthesis family protein [Flectobacillus major]